MSPLELKREELATLSSSLEMDWHLLAQNVQTNYSLYPEWTKIIAMSQGIMNQSQIIAAYENGRLVTVLPLTVSEKRFIGTRIRTLQFISNYVSYHNDVLSSLTGRQTLDILLTEAEQYKAQVIQFTGLRAESAIAHTLRSMDSSLTHVYTLPGEASPYLPLDHWPELLRSKSKKFRYKLRKRAEILERDDVHMHWFEKPEDCPVLLAAIQNIEDNSWKKQEGFSIFERPHERYYHEMLLELLSRSSRMFANVLFYREAPIAYNLCCVHDGWVGQLKTSFDRRFAELSPGALVIDMAIRHAIEIGATEFDFLGDADPHKLTWTKHVRTHTNYFVYLASGFRGRVVAGLKKLKNHVTS